MGSKRIPDGMTRGDLYYADPNKLIIVGGKPFTKHASDTDDGAEHPLYDKRVTKLGALDPHMVRSVMAAGVIQPVRVRKDGDDFYVIVGRHRVAWAREANRLLAKEGSEPIAVPCVIARTDDTDAIGMQVTENEVRIAPDIATRAFNAARLAAAGRTPQQIADRFGVSVTRAKEYLALAEATPDVHRAIDSGRLTPSAAIELARLPRAEQKDALAALPDGARVTARDAKRATTARKRAKDETAADASGTGYPRPPVGDLRKLAGFLTGDEANGSLDAFNGIAPVNLLRWIVGEVSSRQVTGLNQVLRDAGIIE